jgi:hypothetical protein
VKKTFRPTFHFGTLLLALAFLAAHISGQAVPAVPYERTFMTAVADVERVVRNLRPSSSGRLPTVEGFVQASDLPIDHFERGYYECTFQVVTTPSGGATVRATAKITAWYNDPTPGRSGYHVLVSNGHIENDFLDRIQDALGPNSVPKPAGSLNPARLLRPQPVAEACGRRPGSIPLLRIWVNRRQTRAA